MGLFGILRKKETTKKWKVLYRNRRMEIKSFSMMAKDENEIISEFDGFFKYGEYIGACEIK